MQYKVVKGLSVINAIAILVAIVAPFFAVQDVKAANLGEAFVRLDRLKANPTTTGGTVCAKSTTVDVETTVKVTFPTGFGVNTTAASWVVNNTNLPAGSIFWIGMTSGTTAASLVAGQDVTFPSGDMVVGTLYCFNFTGTSTLTNPTAGDNKTGVITTQKAGPTAIDSAGYALSILSDDQIVVNATVLPSFALTFAGGTDNFTSNLSGTTTSTTGKTAQIVTNAANGWTVWVKSANAALNTTGATIPTYGTLNATPDDIAVLPATASYYVLDVDKTTDSATAGTGTVTIDPEYNGVNTTSGGTLATTFQPVATANGVTDGDVITLIERARVSAIQKAANDYTDTLTVVAAGLF